MTTRVEHPLGALATRPVFEVAGEQVTWADVVASAQDLDRWPPATPFEGADEAAFRRARDLFAIEDVEAWLEHWDLDISEWRAALGAEPLGDPGRATVVGGICSGALMRLAEEQASALAALVERDGELGPVPGRALRAREALSELRAGAASPRAVAVAVAARRIDWTRVVVRSIRHELRDVVAEIALAVRDDGQPLEDAAAPAGAAIATEAYVVAEAPGALRPVIKAAVAGDLVGPLPDGSDWWLGVVDERVAPHPDDPATRDLAATVLADAALVAVTGTHVRWAA